MLKHFLRAAGGEQVGNTAALAATPAMIEAMVGELERRGLLQRAGECGVACKGCPSETTCEPRDQGGAWMLTTAGRRYAAS